MPEDRREVDKRAYQAAYAIVLVYTIADMPLVIEPEMWVEIRKLASCIANMLKQEVVNV